MNAIQLRRFVPRATRYVLRPQDKKILRFVHADDHSGIGAQETTILNMSKSGLAFLVERDFAPSLGDLIKVEFAVPAGGQIAWWARVVRTQEYTKNIWWMKADPSFKDLILVGVHFHDMPDGHQAEIQSGLNKQFIEMLKVYRREQLRRVWLWFIHRGWKVLALIFATVVVFSILYWLTLPSENYDPIRGAPWGSRFHFFE